MISRPARTQGASRAPSRRRAAARSNAPLVALAGEAGLRSQLDAAFRHEAKAPSTAELGSGIRAEAYWSFPHLEVVLAACDRPPTDSQARVAWQKRLNRRPIPLVLIIAGGDARQVRGVQDRLKALGFDAEPRGDDIYVLRAGGCPAAAILAFPRGCDLDRTGAGGELPIAALLNEMKAAGARPSS